MEALLLQKKHYKDILIEATHMYQSENGFINTSHKKYRTKEEEKRLKNLLLIKHRLRSSRSVWLWLAIIEPKHRQILHIDISFERTMLFVVAERFIASLIDKYGQVSGINRDGGIYGIHHKHASF